MKKFIYVIGFILLIAQGIINTVLYFWAFSDFFASHYNYPVSIVFIFYFSINLIISLIATFMIYAAEA